MKQLNKLDLLEDLIIDKINNAKMDALRLSTMHYETSFMRDKRMHLYGEIDALNMVLANIEQMKEGDANE